MRFDRVTGTWLPVSLAVAAPGAFLLTLSRVPVPWSDEILYASLARSLQLGDGRTPSILAGAPSADHLAFYGPVFFALGAAAFQVAGVTAVAFRSVTLAGVVGAALGAAWLVRAFGHSRSRQIWAVALVLLSPEAGGIATSGRMDAVALAWTMLALAAYAYGLRAGGRMTRGIATGMFLAAAALTVPRTFLFVGAFVGVSTVVGHRTRAARRQWLAAVVTLLVIVAAWGTWASGSPLAWARRHVAIASSEGIEIAIVPGAPHVWNLTPWHGLTSLAAGVGLWLVLRARPLRALDDATAVVVGTCVANALLCLAIMNFPFALGSYFAVPLLATVVACAPETITRTHREAWLLVALLLCADIAVRLGKYARVAATWQAKDPAPVDAFVARHVAPGSVVYGPAHYYFYAVERSGSRYLVVPAVSPADWADNVAPVAARPAPAGPRWLLWPATDPRPAGFDCAGLRAVAQLPSTRDARDRLGWIGRLTGSEPDTFPAATLFELPTGCPD